MANAETFNQETLGKNFAEIMEQMIKSYGAETIVYRLQKRLEENFDANSYNADFARKEIEAVKECQQKISAARYVGISDDDLGVNQD